jgi:hypothetical protein
MFHETTIKLFNQKIEVLVEYDQDGPGAEGITINDVELIHKEENLGLSTGATRYQSALMHRIGIFPLLNGASISTLAREIDKAQINQRITETQNKWDEIFNAFQNQDDLIGAVAERTRIIGYF